jgi:hypothetical protein
VSNLNPADRLFQSWGFTVGAFDRFLITLFERYAELLKKRFSDDFQEVRNPVSSSESRTLTIIDVDCHDGRLHADANSKRGGV